MCCCKGARNVSRRDACVPDGGNAILAACQNCCVISKGTYRDVDPRGRLTLVAVEHLGPESRPTRGTGPQATVFSVLLRNQGGDARDVVWNEELTGDVETTRRLET